MLKVATQNDLGLLNCRSLGKSSQSWAQSRREETDISDRRGPPDSASCGLKGQLNDPSLSTACEGKQYANLLALMCAVVGLYEGLIFTFLQTPSSLHHSVPRPSKCRASGNSHLFVGPLNHPADHEMSSFHHSGMQMTGATIISHPVIISYAFWKGRKCIVVSVSQYCLPLERTMTLTQMH